MKRGPITASTPGLAAQPVQVPHRTSRVLLEAALLALQLREYTIAALGEYLTDKHPDHHLDMERLIERLVQRGEIEFADETIGLTDAGEDAAARIRDRPALKIAQPVHSESQRRALLLAGTATHDLQALTRGLVRCAASSADLATPPPRSGAQACLELPSRIGDRLHYRDGRVTDMGGVALQGRRTPATYRPTRDGTSAVARVAFPERPFIF